MDGVVIFVAEDRSRALIWCSDHGPLGLARRDAMPGRHEPPLTVGELVHFEPIEDGGNRLCGKLRRVGVPGLPELPAMLRRETRAQANRTRLRLVPTRHGDSTQGFSSGAHCG